MKLGAALLAWLLVAPAASAAPSPHVQAADGGIERPAVLVTWLNRSRVARPQLARRRLGSPKRSRKTRATGCPTSLCPRPKLRFRVENTQRAYVHPATHFASSDSSPDLPPMGLRLRMKASFPSAGYSPEVQVILGALKRYGMLVADNG